MPDFHVRFTWQSAGAVTLTGDKPSFPAMSAKPGIWRILVDETAHHGASRDLRATMYQLAAPGPTQTTNQRVHNAALAGLRDQKPVRVDIVTAAEGKVAGLWVPLDLESDDVRALLKASAMIGVEEDDPDPDSAAYRAALRTAQRDVTILAASALMTSAPAGKPNNPQNEDVKLLRRTLETLNGLVAEHDRYWFGRWGREGNPTNG